MSLWRELRKNRIRDLQRENATLKERAEKAERERDNWMETAQHHTGNELFYMGLLDDVAKHLGPDVFVSDDGSIQQDPIRLKIAEMVGVMKAQLATLRAERDSAIRTLKRIAKRTDGKLAIQIASVYIAEIDAQAEDGK